MNASPIVSNASPLIALSQLDCLDLLNQFFHTIIVPPAVVAEVSPTVVLPDWVEKRSLSQPIGPRILSTSLGPGESEAISLGLEVGARLIILDERAGRRLAHGLGLSVIGTLGVLLMAKKRGVLPDIKSYLDRLIDFDFHISQSLYERVLQDADE